MLEVLDLKYTEQFFLSARSKALEWDTKLYNESSEESFQKSSLQIAIWYIWNPPDYKKLGC